MWIKFHDQASLKKLKNHKLWLYSQNRLYICLSVQCQHNIKTTQLQVFFNKFVVYCSLFAVFTVIFINSCHFGLASMAEQAFIKYNISYTTFHACKTVLGASPHTWEIMPIKEQTYTLLIIWYSGINCTKLVLKPLAAKTVYFSISVLCIAPFLQIILFTW